MDSYHVKRFLNNIENQKQLEKKYQLQLVDKKEYDDLKFKNCLNCFHASRIKILKNEYPCEKKGSGQYYNYLNKNVVELNDKSECSEKTFLQIKKCERDCRKCVDWNSCNLSPFKLKKVENRWHDKCSGCENYDTCIDNVTKKEIEKDIEMAKGFPLHYINIPGKYGDYPSDKLWNQERKRFL
jgi:hypothetical protein